MFGLSTVQIIVGAAIAIVIGGAAIYIKTTIKNEGANEAMQEVRDDNFKAGNAGENARLDLRECRALGVPWEWDFVASKCVSNP